MPKLSPRAVTLLVAVTVAAMAASMSTATPRAHSSFAPTRILDVDEAVDEIAANGSHAGFLSGGSADVWDARTGVRRNVGGADSGISDVAITNDVVGYLGFEDTITLHFRFVET